MRAAAKRCTSRKATPLAFDEAGGKALGAEVMRYIYAGAEKTARRNLNFPDLHPTGKRGARRSTVRRRRAKAADILGIATSFFVSNARSDGLEAGPPAVSDYQSVRSLGFLSRLATAWWRAAPLAAFDNYEHYRLIDAFSNF